MMLEKLHRFITNLFKWSLIIRNQLNHFFVKDIDDFFRVTQSKVDIILNRFVRGKPLTLV